MLRCVGIQEPVRAFARSHLLPAAILVVKDTASQRVYGQVGSHVRCVHSPKFFFVALAFIT